MTTEDCYQTLGVNPKASFEEIRNRFRFLAQAYHPDKFGSDTHKAQAEEEFKRINASYEILSDPVKRAEYDRKQSIHSSEVNRHTGQHDAPEQRRTEYERPQREPAEAEKRRVDFEQQQKTQDQDIPTNTRDGINGTISGVFYFSEKADLYSLLRFYEDGLVIKVVISGIKSIYESWSDISKWFNRDYSNRGKYLLVDDFIRFKTTSKDGKVEYDGRFVGDSLILNSFSYINGHRATQQEYIPLNK